MNVLILGSGGREHALSWKIAQSSLLSQLYIAPGNAGTEELGINLNIDISDFNAISKVLLQKEIGMVIVGPEVPLVNGIHDFIKENPKTQHIAVIGPRKKGAQLEGSKSFAKDFMIRHSIPTALHKSFSKKELNEALQYLAKMKAPYVLKADGLAGGKGVLIIDDLKTAQKELKEILENKKFGTAGSQVVIEKFLNGTEVSMFVLTDGKNFKMFPMAKDYKRIGEGDTGLNTGGMGAISPVAEVTELFMAKVKEEILKPTIRGLADDEIPYEGFLFFGLMNVSGEPYVIEYNVRLGDPETQVILPLLKSDLLDLLDGIATGTLSEKDVSIDERAACTVTLASGGYPGKYEVGKEISGLKNTENVFVFHAGTKKVRTKTFTDGGRVLNVTALGRNYEKALELAYTNVERINFEKKYFRNDIGYESVKKIEKVS